MVYFLGIGGIGMSALAQWCHQQGKAIAGYDRYPSDITHQLESQGIPISYRDSEDTIPDEFRVSAPDRLVVYTPAIPEDNHIRQFLLSKGLEFKKRSQVLGIITKPYYTIAVAGTHGKTTTSSMIGHILKSAGRPCTAFVGGITQNYHSNLLLDTELAKDQIMVVEADEFDRSFLTLHPDIAVVTAMDADHLDVYGDTSALQESFGQFLQNIKQNGKLFIQESVFHKLQTYIPDRLSVYRYGIDSGIFKAINIQIVDSTFIFDFYSPEINMDRLNLNLPGFHNVENAMSAIAVAWSLGLDEKEIRQALASYTGVKRRFEFIINQPDLVLIDDYAHHPVEIKALLYSVRKLFPQQAITAVFQPHLFSRTKDFAIEFASSLDMADKVLLMDIYPAREKPIPGITSNIIAKELTVPYELVNEENVCQALEDMELEVVVTIGAGDIDKMVEPIKQTMLNKYHENK